ncbi:MAG: bifunctional riboflavin kinase/FAD synthetase [Marinilabiliales bacterium]|nr:bifunctional riboflavin kinase/FAD synthetase [Marinilabiliales bacterium]
MQIHYGLDSFVAKLPVVTIGTFDGVHLGHREVVTELKRIAASCGGESVIFTFFPHPRMVVSPQNNEVRLLSSVGEKIDLLADLQPDHLVIYPFTPEFAALSHADFVRTILVDRMHIFKLVTGYDHRLGHDRQGDFHSLVGQGAEFGFEVEQLQPLWVENVTVSSTKIRRALESGNIFRANQLLGYDYVLRGVVVEGKKLGRTIGFPTANVVPEEAHKLVPANGVYAVEITWKENRFRGMLNIGFRPTVNEDPAQLTIEANIFDFSADLYGESVTLHFVDRIRDEVRFNGVEVLKQQLMADKISTMRIFAARSQAKGGDNLGR